MLPAAMAHIPASPPILPGVSLPVATALVVLASMGFGAVPFFARSLTDGGMAPEAVALSRYLIAALVLGPFAWRARHQPGPLLWGLAAGLCVGLGWIGYVRALAILPVATVGVIYMTFPVFALLISRLLFGERATSRGLAAAGVVVVAAALAAGPDLALPGAAGPLAGALLAPLTFGAAIAILVHRLTPIPPLARLGAFSIGSAVGLIPLVAALPAEAVLPPTPEAFALIAGIALLTALLPQLLYTIFAPVVGSARAATAGAVELPTMILIGWLLLGEVPGAAALLASAMIVGAILLAPATGPTQGAQR